MEKGVSFLVTVALMALASSFASASDPSPLQDTCVAIDEPKTAVAIAGLSSQNPGVITISNAVFGSNPPINPDFLATAFQLDKKVVEFLQARF
uniref:Cupin type-1 domain-containing protein n=2 Tax=Vitis vinifera TaxID=29760 RepID=A5AIA3_VITVI|nr:hypothetical protein VITISV_024252 [Vitis vinifera]